MGLVNEMLKLPKKELDLNSVKHLDVCVKVFCGCLGVVLSLILAGIFLFMAIAYLSH